MSIKELDLALLEPNLGKDTHTIALLRRFTAAIPVPQPTAEDQGNHQSIIAQRRRVLREISLRRGQPQFRERLIRRYGLRCQITGYSFAAAIEAAHIQPYARCEDNGAGNGLLLRSDLHTLFDLGSIGIDPATLRIAFNPDCLCAAYAPYDGAVLCVNDTSGPDGNALAQHWEFFQSCLPRGHEK
ncbi:HNH endonuclease signature motif containing protein [Mesorhizobium sp.]|uniref:HNH endonuclease n=1 Tax=Mesorhizobium sp. TaxID=1871066 RepID=UPI0011F53D69|nr:HNH endonuclease signature motif containing protein [Mesorhizobium sp.]TIL42324.1 MAG: HNH endonuclease [Mesorhizobium sp.]